jgi:hypothetical protein
MKTTRNFKSKVKYIKWVQYGQMHGVFKKSRGNTPVKIGGKVHKVKHK